MVHISCNIGTCDLPDMYALSPRALGIHIRQITRAYVTTITYSPGSFPGNIYILPWLQGNIRNIALHWPLIRTRKVVHV